MATTDTLQERLNRGSELLKARRLDEAQALAQALVSEFSEHGEVRLFASDVESLRGSAPAAFAHLEALPEALRDHPRIFLRQAELLLFDGRRRKALDIARRGRSRIGADVRLLCRLGRVFLDAGALDDARAFLAAALDQRPGDPALLYLLAVVETQLGLHQEARQHLEAVLAVQPRNGGALLLRSQLGPWSADDNHCAALRAMARESAADTQLQALLQYALGRESEDLGDYEASAAAFAAGASAYRQLLSYDEPAELAAQADIRERVSTARFASLAPGIDAAAPIFLVGLPRAGASIISKLLAAHSNVRVIGPRGDFRRLLGELASEAAPAEATDAEACLAVGFAELGLRYLETAQELLHTQASAAETLVDTTLDNYLHTGFIAAALPSARFVHVTRDPLDHCYALYKTLFFGAQSYSYNVDELHAYYESYRRHMRHWHALLPGRILDVSYEALVSDTSAEAARVFAHLGLPGKPLIPEGIHRQSIGSGQRGGADFKRLAERLASPADAPLP